MTKARDLANIISGGFTADDIPNLDAAKITSGSFADARIPNLAASKITSGTFADARIAASNVSQHATSFDDNNIVNDISTLAIRQASDNNRSAYNTNSQYVDVFQDSTGIGTTSNASRSSDEYLGSITSQLQEHSSDSNTTLLLHMNGTNGSTTFTDDGNIGFSQTANGNVALTTSNKKFGTASADFDGSGDFITVNIGASPNNFVHSSNDFTYEAWVYSTGSTGAAQVVFQAGTHDAAGEILMKMYSSNTINTEFRTADGNSVEALYGTALSFNTWHHVAKVRDGNTLRLYLDGVQVASKAVGGHQTFGVANDLKIGRMPGYSQDWQGQIDEVRISKGICRYPNGTTFTPNQVTVSNASGSVESNVITAPSSVSSMGAIITYQDNAGTNTLNTDIVLKLSADNGSNYSTATLTAMPDFSTGIKMAKVNDLSVTAGTQLKYKIEFANQALGSKEARIRGVALQY